MLFADKTRVESGSPGYQKLSDAVGARAKFGPARDSFLRALNEGHVYTFEGTGGARAITFGSNVYVPTSSLTLNNWDLGFYLLHEDFHLIDFQQAGLIGQILRPESYADTFAVSATLRGTAGTFSTEVDLYRGVLNGYSP
jgi:hypothetical protein